MFKDYKEILKKLRDVQTQLWKDSMASFPGAIFPSNLNDWQQQTLDNVNSVMGQAIGQSLELQQQWLAQWTERVNEQKLKPKLFAELSAEAQQSSKRWLENQNQLWGQWIKLLQGSGDPASLPDYEAWERVVRESMESQKELLEDWSQMADFHKLSAKKITKLSNDIIKSMQKSIETEQQLWSHWFSDLSSANPAKQSKTVAKQSPSKKKKKGSNRGASASKAGRAGDDLKKISGIGAGLEKKLKDNGITRFQQIADLSDSDVDELESKIVSFSGRIKRDKWVDQAKKLIS